MQKPLWHCSKRPEKNSLHFSRFNKYRMLLLYLKALANQLTSAWRFRRSDISDRLYWLKIQNLQVLLLQHTFLPYSWTNVAVVVLA